MSIARAGAPAAVPSGWTVTAVAGTVNALHHRDPPAGPGRVVEVMRPAAGALVLGSTQSEAVVDRAAVATRGLALVHRRSGGGAVLVDPDGSLWLDLIVPRGDDLWDDDVVRSFGWVGDVWVAALADLGVAGVAQVRPRPPDPAGRLVCFAGVGAGEVLVHGRKVVGLSQRRTRTHARYQCLAYTGAAAPAAVVDLLREPAGGPTLDELRRRLASSVTALPVAADRLVAAVLARLPAGS